MGNSELSNSENILVKVDENNLIYIDPNSVVDNDGNVQPRGLKQENLVMYVNLEADLVPRSTLLTSKDTNTLYSIAEGNLNFLKNQTGDGNFDTSWTDSFVGKDIIDENGNVSRKTVGGKLVNYDSSGQSFGMESINISVKGANFTPTITINFIDIRGKTLFESSTNSPYKAFFHLPWPIFYLTVKGYYGKAIRYRLHMTKFSSKFNESTGNFEVATTFVGSTYAYLNDITLSQINNSPYMFMVEKVDNTSSYQPHTGMVNRTVSKTSKGFTVLKSVYAEYRQKGLVPKDFPDRTLRELGYIAQSLDKVLEKEIFDQVVNPKVFSAVQDFEKGLDSFMSQIKAWALVNLTKDYITENGVNYYGLVDKQKANFTIISGGTPGSLSKIIDSYSEEISKLETTTNKVLNKSKSEFSNAKISVKNINDVKNYSRVNENVIQVAIDKLINDVGTIRHNFVEQKTKLQDTVEVRMNEIMKDKNKGFGFLPTVRNVFAVLLANADTYIRLMKDTHRQAIESGDVRKNLLKGLNFEQKGDAIYPWPEVMKKTSNGKQNVLAYPGEFDLIQKLQSNNKTLWPEVDFVENFIGIATNRIDSNISKEDTTNNVNYIFETDVDKNNINHISGIDVVNNNPPYNDKIISSFLYELYERARYFTLFDSFNNNFLKALADEEFINIKSSISEDSDLVDAIKKFTNTDTLLKTTIITDGVSYGGFLPQYSPHERFPYLKDQIPTVGYLSDVLAQPFSISQYDDTLSRKKDGTLADKVNPFLNDYTPETYRTDIYPFSSNEYLSYLNKKTFTSDNFKFNGLLQVDTTQGFICSPVEPMSWVKDNYRFTPTPLILNGQIPSTNVNLFSQKISISGTSVNILNTPYFHNQLYSDFTKVGNYSKYTGSAYLLLNSLPFIDLEDEFTYLQGSSGKSILTSSLFREIGSTHFVPYHLMVKWGSIYHRYKNFILNGIDILDGTLNVSGITQPIIGQTFFNNGVTGTTFETFHATTGTTVTYGGKTDVGFHPIYDSIFHQIVNGYPHYNITSGDTSYSTYMNAGGISSRNREYGNKINYWSNFTKNTIYSPTDTYYTLLPSDGGNKNIQNSDNFDFAEQYNFRTMWWDDETVNTIFSGLTFASPTQYTRNTSTSNDNIFSIDVNYRKVIDLIGTFSPDILSYFEDMFLNFASAKTPSETPTSNFPNVTYNNFQDLLKGLTTVAITPTDQVDFNSLIENTLKVKQLLNSYEISNKILSKNNLMKFTLANPKEIDPHLFHGFAGVNTTINTFSVLPYDPIDSTTPNLNLIKLYIGEDIDGYYQEFFITNNVKLNEENIISFRPVVLIYGGWRKMGNTPNTITFRDYLKTSIFTNEGVGINVAGSENRLKIFLNMVLGQTSVLGNIKKKNDVTNIMAQNGYNTDGIKLELYNTFKSFNDKWSSGNSIGQRLLMEEFLFLDKANKDIGDKFFLNLDRIIELLDPKNSKTSLYGAISILIRGTGLDMRALPAYVNFYGTNVNTKTKMTPSKRVAKNLFGTFLEVDNEECSPKVIIQLVGGESKHLADLEGKEYVYADDGFYIGSNVNNPLFITSLESFTANDLSKSNKVVAFEVSFGDQNQGIFKGVSLDQNTIKNTSESFYVLEHLARSESGAGAFNIDVGLFDYYKQASYQCEVTCMGNVMIQPTMFFYLKNIPMFRGSYWITEVSHSIVNNTISTKFKGSRIPYSSLPDPKDSFVASYRQLFDKISASALKILKQQKNQENTTEITISGSTGYFTTDPGNVSVKGEKIIQDAGMTLFGIPFNGFNNEMFIQKVSYNNTEYLRARAIIMDGPNYPINSGVTMSIIDKSPNITPLTWGELGKSNNTHNFYTTKFQLDKVSVNKIETGNTYFFNPKNGNYLMVNPSYGNLSLPEGNRTVNGAVSVGPNIDGYGIGLSYHLMKSLGLSDGDVVYFNIT